MLVRVVIPGSGMDLFYPKPFRIEELVSIVHERSRLQSSTASRSTRRSSDSSIESYDE